MRVSQLSAVTWRIFGGEGLEKGSLGAPKKRIRYKLIEE
jgi:hypothetical protein